MRLIDEDAIIEEIEKNVLKVGQQTEGRRNGKTLALGIMSGLNSALKIILKQPTAYDPDRVVEQLEEYLFEKYCVEGDAEIERIVKGGGVDAISRFTDSNRNR